MRDRIQLRRVSSVVATVVATIALMLGTALPAWAAEPMTLSFVRHGESTANAAGVIDTSVPGPNLTEVGRQQALAVATALAPNDYDGIYASSMVRTQQTAAPLADILGLPIVVLPGLREIDAGVFEGQSEDSGLGRIGYVLAPIAWTLGARFVPVLGSTDGNAFDDRVDDAVQKIYDSGNRNAVVFSHGATIMFWTMMNVDNPDLGLILSRPLDNTSVVVITGNPEDGWTLENWDGVAVSAESSLFTKLFVDVRNLVTAPQTAAYRVQQAFIDGDIAGIVNAIRGGVVDVVSEVVGFVPNVVSDVVGSLGSPAPIQSDEPATTNLTTSTHTSALRSAKPVVTADTQKTTVATKSENSNEATDLTDGNKVEPGETAAASVQRDQTDEVDTEVTPIAEQTADPADSATSATNDADATANSDESSDAERDAA
jgi:broad specificity phosphatase PhoE